MRSERLLSECRAAVNTGSVQRHAEDGAEALAVDGFAGRGGVAVEPLGEVGEFNLVLDANVGDADLYDALLEAGNPVAAAKGGQPYEARLGREDVLLPEGRLPWARVFRECPCEGGEDAN